MRSIYGWVFYKTCGNYTKVQTQTHRYLPRPPTYINALVPIYTHICIHPKQTHTDTKTATL